MALREWISPERCFVLESAPTWEAALRELSNRLASVTPHLAADAVEAKLLARERKSATVLPEGLAVPHAMIEGLTEQLVAVAVIRRPVARVGLAFVLLGPPERPWDHLRVLARIARVCNSAGAIDRLRSSANAAQLYQRLVEEDQQHV